MNWRANLSPKSPVWQSVVGYADERIAQLTSVCVDTASSDADIRSAQAGIQELRKLKLVPEQLNTSAEVKQASTVKRGGNY